MNVSDTCNAAADLIEVRGWTHGEGWTDDPAYDGGPLCLEGAIQAAAGVTSQFRLAACPAYAAVKAYLGQYPFIWNDRLPYPWHGNPHTTDRDAAEEWAREQVIATLRAVAVIHAAREDESVETRTVEAVAR